VFSSNFASFPAILYIFIHAAKINKKIAQNERKTEVKGEKKELGTVQRITVF